MRLLLLPASVQVPDTCSVRPRLVQPEELEVLVAVNLQDVVLVACLDADDVARLDVPLPADIHDLGFATRDQVQLVVLVVVAIVLSALLRHSKEPAGRQLAPVRLGLLPEMCFASVNHRHGAFSSSSVELGDWDCRREGVVPVPARSVGDL
jgi:hypothetical protein